MIGSGAIVFAVWGYCCGKAEPEDHTVSLNPILLSTIIGEPVKKIQKAIAYLCAPDPKSRCTDHEGRRLIHQGGFDYFVVTHAEYRKIRNSEDIRAYNREMKRKERERERKRIVIDSQRQSMTSVSVSDPVSEEGDNKGDGSDKEKLAMLAKIKTETETEKNILSDQYRTEFEVAWHSYPDKSGKEKAWKAYKLAKPVLSDVLAGLARYVAYVQQRRKTDFADLKFQNGATWFSQSGWMSEWIPSIITKYKGRE